MKIVVFSFILLFSVGPLEAQDEKKIVILHTNDMHSRITGYGPESAYTPLTTNDDNTIGGFARIASILKNEKEKNPGITLILDAGDFLMGTLFQGLEPQTGFQLRLMKKMGYDAVCIGNHEFDNGPGTLAEIVSSAQKGGGFPDVLLSNAVLSTRDTGDDGLEKLFNSGAVKRTFIIERGGLKFGFFSLMGKEADENAAFATPVTFSKQIPAARYFVKELQNEKCDIIICLSHSGVSLDKKGNRAGEDAELAYAVKGINVIISGHSHTKLEKPMIVNGIPIVQAGENGEWVGKLSLSFNNNTVKTEDYSLFHVDDSITGDIEINTLVEDQKKAVSETILKPLNLDYNNKVAEAGFLLECIEQGDIKGSNLGPMVADAIRSYVNNHDSMGTDLSMVAVGVIRDRIIPGFQTAPDIFRIMSMGSGNDNVPGYPLAKVYVTGKELKNVLEILQVAYKSTPGNYCYYSGIRVEFNPGKGLLRKIQYIGITRKDGTVERVDFSKMNKKLYSITANAYMLEFVGIIKKKSFGLINVVPKDASGKPVTDMKNAWIDMDEKKAGLQEGKEWLAIMEYLQAMKDQNNNGIPDIDRKYAKAIQTFFTVK